MGEDADYHAGQGADRDRMFPKRENVIQLTDSVVQACVKMADGNPGAATVAAQLIENGPMGIIDLCHADDLGLRGSLLWQAFKNCGQKVDVLRDALRARNRKLLFEGA